MKLTAEEKRLITAVQAAQNKRKALIGVMEEENGGARAIRLLREAEDELAESAAKLRRHEEKKKEPRSKRPKSRKG